MSALAMPQTTTTFVVPVSNGIFDHCARIGVAIWVFLWMIDHTTQETEPATSNAEGLVYGGRPIRAQEVAHDLQMAARTVQSHLNHLVAAGYLRRIDHNVGSAAGYAVRKSKKWKPKLAVIGGKQAHSTPAEFGGGALISAGGAPNSARGAQKTAGGALNSAALYRNSTQTIHTTHRLTGDEEFVLTTEPAESGEDRLQRAVEAGWRYFLDQTRKSPQQYTFSPKREQMGLNGFQALVKFAIGNQHPDPYTAAGELFNLAVDRLANSPFHNGRNDRSKKYLDWHQLFRGDQFEAPTKLLEYWLDDSRWPE